MTCPMFLSVVFGFVFLTETVTASVPFRSA
jgi:hypothetical protein